VNRTRILTMVGYGAYFWLTFFLFAYWTFPYGRLAAFLTDKVAESGSGYTLDIGGLSPYWFTGVELEDVKVRKAAAETLPTTPATKGAQPLDQAVRVESARARLKLLPLLTGSKAVTFDAELGEGEIDGSFEQDGAERKVVATLDKVDLGKLGVLESMVSLPMKGMLTGNFDLTLGEQPQKTTGKIKVTIQKLVVGDGKAKLKLGTMGGLTIDPISAGDVVMDVDVQNGVGSVRNLSANGSDLKLKGSGDIRFNQPLARSRLNVLLRLELTDAYRNKSSRTKAMFALLEGSSVPQVAMAKTPDGAYELRLTGSFRKVQALPANAPQSATGPSPSLAAPGGGAADDDDE